MGGSGFWTAPGRTSRTSLPDHPAAPAVLGTINLRTAIMAARGGRASPAWDAISHAREVSARTGRETQDYGLLFGPANVAIHEVAVAVELGDADEAIRRGAELTLPASVPRERSSHHYIDLSRAWLWQRDHTKALACVARASSSPRSGRDITRWPARQ